MGPAPTAVSTPSPPACLPTGLSCTSSLGTSTFTTTAPPVAGPGTATASITLAANDTVTCTFTNTNRGQPLLDTVTSPPGDPTSSTYTTTGTGYATTTLTDAAEPNGQNLSPAPYSYTDSE